MPVYQFYQDRKDFYRVQAKDKETALKLLEKADDMEPEDASLLYTFSDGYEEEMEFNFDGEIGKY